MLPPDLQSHFAASGFAIVEELILASELESLRREADRLLAESPDRGGARNVLGRSLLLRELAVAGPIFEMAVAILGAGARPTKLTIFDKGPRANWKVPWHQDLTIAVAERQEVEGFGPWTVKGGVPHVQPPLEVLQGLLAIRLHLDDTPSENGALRVLPGSHRRGRLSRREIESLRQEGEEVVCPVPAGGSMLMRPLLLHASHPSRSPSRRRVLHFELSAEALPGGLSWA